MNYLVRFCVVFLVFFSCSKPSELSGDFNCGVTKLKNKTQILDFNKNFRLNVPDNWKTEFYYNKNTSEIFTADTTKQLTETYILDASFNLGTVVFDTRFFARNDSIASLKKLNVIQSKKLNFQSKESYYYILKGFKNNYPYHQFNLTVKLTDQSYFNTYVEIYGEDAVDARICKAIAIIDKVEFLQ